VRRMRTARRAEVTPKVAKGKEDEKPLDHGENFADRHDCMPGRLINTNMVDTRITTHIDIGEQP
jgi:hypothetical protein